MDIDNVRVFEDTETKYETVYKQDTEDLIKNRTYVHLNQIQLVGFEHNPNMHISVINDGTVNAGKTIKWETGNKTAILNFADALTPGGLLLVGASTQEENICRCSNLYASLTSNKAQIYYQINRASMHGVYTNSLIYSEDVLFFKDDAYYTDELSYKLDVITCPAPSIIWDNPTNEYTTIYYRIEQIIKSAILYGAKNIVLGAWGCGAFGQNPHVVADCFREVLKEYDAFDNVIFAIRSCREDYASNTTSNYYVFNEVFG